MATKNAYFAISTEWQKCADIDGAPTFEDGKSYVIQAIGAYGYTLLCEATEKPSEDYKGGLRIANDASNAGIYKCKSGSGYDLYVKTTGTGAAINVQEEE